MRKTAFFVVFHASFRIDFRFFTPFLPSHVNNILFILDTSKNFRPLFKCIFRKSICFSHVFRTFSHVFRIFFRNDLVKKLRKIQPFNKFTFFCLRLLSIILNI